LRRKRVIVTPNMNDDRRASEFAVAALNACAMPGLSAEEVESIAGLLTWELAREL
jgi:hypothetical protein